MLLAHLSAPSVVAYIFICFYPFLSFFYSSIDFPNRFYWLGTLVSYLITSVASRSNFINNFVSFLKSHCTLCMCLFYFFPSCLVLFLSYFSLFLVSLLDLLFCFILYLFNPLLIIYHCSHEVALVWYSYVLSYILSSDFLSYNACLLALLTIFSCGAFKFLLFLSAYVLNFPSS